MNPDIRRAVPADREVVVALRREASEWLAVEGIGQWEKPWPSEAEQNARIDAAIARGGTWMFCEGGVTGATVTFFGEDRGGFWEPTLRRSGTGTAVASAPALYLQRMIVGAAWRGRKVGARILDWASECGRRSGAEFLRVDIWRGNDGLEAYYSRQGFTRAGVIPDDVLRDLGFPEYPSTVLMQRGIPGGEGGPFDPAELWRKMV
ncbi:GNAT family N-acetyltransferase [Planobispora siamensis]|uniref:N-acetyltransferase domain-containing protein n=1 Tax=Planobispora siamensis TaxID=936338 RepID=A0A8J3SES7_9ACTN|nr:GNAT family N-acetyltransferase [Planobispora siamensis]GIH91557.1 hypothetical protein Psi01_21870 [Planobispora siamensis]